MFSMYNIIAKKQHGDALTADEIDFFVKGYTAGDIPSYQMSALLMAIYFKGMTNEETAILTDAMAHSGEVIDLSTIPGFKVDKHSTGGVGDKATFVTVPLAVALGEKVAKFSGRGLGHTGGTIDKLESIPGFRTDLEIAEFIEIVQNVGGAISGATVNIAPADKKIYALRDVTATVESMPLIASSVMSKKIASGADGIILDVKCGSGAFMKDAQSARDLATLMQAIGVSVGKKVVAYITNMDQPLGYCIGNALELAEAIMLLRGDYADISGADNSHMRSQDLGSLARVRVRDLITRYPADLAELCISQSATSLQLSKGLRYEDGISRANNALETGAAYQKFCDIVVAQGGNVGYLENIDLLLGDPQIYPVIASVDGYIFAMQTTQIGMSSVALGAGRAKMGDPVDNYAGIILNKKVGDQVREGEVIAYLLATDDPRFAAPEVRAANAEKIFKDAVTISSSPPKPLPTVIDVLW